jgi:hypothetical protein
MTIQRTGTIMYATGGPFLNWYMDGSLFSGPWVPLSYTVSQATTGYLLLLGVG